MEEKKIIEKIYNRHEFRYRRREVLGMSAQQLADKMGVYLKTIYRYEDGSRTPSLYDVVRLAHHLGIPILDLAEKTGNDMEAFRFLLTLENFRFKAEGGEPITTDTEDKD